MNKKSVKREKIKEFSIARAFAIICMIAVHTEFAVYNYNDEAFAMLFDYLGSPFAAPVFMFMLGTNVVLSSRSTPKKLLIRGISLFGASFLFNIVCHALPFFIIDYRLGTAAAVEDSLHWIFAVDILTFAGLAFIFFAFVKKYNLSNKTLIVFALCASLLSTILIKYCPIDFSSHVLLSSFTSLFYSSSTVGYFSFLGWIGFPIAGYIFVQYLLKTKDKDKFYSRLEVICAIIYLVMVIGSFTIFKDSPLIIYNEEYSYYWMNPYQLVGNIAFCLSWLGIIYFISKLIPKKFDDLINRLNTNLTTIYFIQWFIINYMFVLPYNGQLKVGKLAYILIFIFVIIVSDLLSFLNSRYKKWKTNVLNN